MSSLELEAWPPVGTTYAHWTDLVLATQLSAFRRGYGSVVPVWGGAHSKVLKIKIACRSLWDQPPRRDLSLVAMQRNTQDSSGAWTVTETPRAKDGTLNKVSSQEPHLEKLRVGDHLTTASKLDDIEGALKATARKDGRFLWTRLSASSPGNYKAARDFVLTCVLQPSQCAFHIRFCELAAQHWRCIKIDSTHSCVPTGTSTAPQDLVSRMSTFAHLELEDGVCNSAGIVALSNRSLQIVEKQVGPYPVEAPSHDVDLSDASPVPEPSSEAETGPDGASGSDSTVDAWQSAASSHAGLHRSLVDACAAAFSAETDHAQARVWLERCTEDALAAQARLESQRKLVEAHRVRAQKKRQRLKQQVEREQRRSQKAEEEKRKKVSSARTSGK
ncbi:hypothetical protein JCM9279_003536 [Rhodotorula babjevae]